MDESRLFRGMQRLERSKFVKTIRGGLVTLIPVLMTGAFALILMSVPVDAYMDFIQTFCGGFIYSVLNAAHAATFGVLSIHMTLSLALSYRREHEECRDEPAFGPVFVSLGCFIILSGALTRNVSIDAFGATGMLTAILAGYLGSACFFFLKIRLRKTRRFYARGDDIIFSSAVSMVGPSVMTLIVFTSVNELVIHLSGVDSFYEWTIDLLVSAFLGIGANFGGGLLFVLSTGLLWFFGIHGNNCLEGVTQSLYTPAITENIAAVAAGQAPGNILTKQFFDVFVFMGGCGSAICLLLALFLFSRRTSNRRLMGYSLVPALFNVNETLIFGLPVILNPIMFIPFVLAPVACYLISYAAMSMGLVGLTISSVEWTTPILLGGCIATRSVAGGILQLFNVFVGTLIYMPFVRLLDDSELIAMRESYARLLEGFKAREESGESPRLVDLEGGEGEIAKQLALDLGAALDCGQLTMYYQPQHSAEGGCIGVEALLRWDHAYLGVIYPPLIIELSEEIGRRSELERFVIAATAENAAAIQRILGEDARISANLTGATMMEDGFPEFLRKLRAATPPFVQCIEIVEQTALSFSEKSRDILRAVRDMGVLLAIDDFSMGQTSLNYLKQNCFSLVKLDGSLVRDIPGNPRCVDIIASIVDLSRPLDFSVLAEFVETETQREVLEQIGCLEYQGYLYSPALSLEELESRYSGKPAAAHAQINTDNI